MRDMRIATSFIVVSILQIASPVVADSRLRPRPEAVKVNGIFGRNRLTGNNPQSTFVKNARSRRLPDVPIYHHGQVPSGVTLPEMEQGPLYHFGPEESNLVKKGVKGSRSEKVAHHVPGKGVKEKPVNAIDEDGENTLPPRDDYEYSAPGKIINGKTRYPEGYDDTDYDEETPKGPYKKGYYPKKYQTDKLPSSSPKELLGAKAQKRHHSDEGGGEKTADHTPKDNPPDTMSPPGDAKDAAPKDPEANNGDVPVVPDGSTSTAGGEDATDLTNGGKFCLMQMVIGHGGLHISKFPL